MTYFREFLQDYDSISIAVAQDNEDILSFFHSLEMNQQKSNISYDRSPDFFEFLRLVSPLYYVLLLKDKNGSIKGVGTLIVKESYIDGKPAQVCYLGDLRVSTLKMTVYWRKFYSDLIRKFSQIKEFENCKINYTAILDQNTIAKKTLINNKNSYQYSSLSRYSMINILAPSILFNSTYVAAREELSTEVIEFMDYSQRSNFLGITKEEIKYRKDNWKGFRDNVIVVRNRDREIIAASALWSPYYAKKIKVSSFSKLISLFYKFSKFPSSCPELNSSLRPLYLTTLSFHPKLQDKDKTLALKALINFSLKSEVFKDYHFLTLTESRQVNFQKAYRFCYYQRTHATLYEVTDRSLHRNKLTDIAESLFIEIALI
ncbi:hypothetical protein [Halobacteriovorax sp. HLS]|uniref:hypothetical protein n=1 Tax=Halobacteriovorax sp. HLS TaxID=2234000 RepID=UPI000FD9E725|nr:hypothetical protein [Halobacteriovorax sp. HLS]